MYKSLLLALLVTLLLTGSGCFKREVVFQERQDFSRGEARFKVPLNAEAKKYRMVLEVEIKYAFGSSYRFETHLWTPSDQLKKGEVVEATAAKTPVGGMGGSVVGGSMHDRTDEHVIYEIEPETGTYRVDIVQLERDDRMVIQSVTLRVEK